MSKSLKMLEILKEIIEENSNALSGGRGGDIMHEKIQKIIKEATEF